MPVVTRPFLLTVAAAFATFGALMATARFTASAMPSQPPLHAVVRRPIPANAKTAIFAGGCFWGIEEDLRTIPGVADTRAGFAGGTTPNPTYETVHRSGSAYSEAVKVWYDPKVVSYDRLLDAFFAAHNPTWPHESERKAGKTYRSFVFTEDAEQERDARAHIAQLTRSKRYPGAPFPIQTQIRPATIFWPASEEHQRYYEKRGGGICRLAD